MTPASDTRTTLSNLIKHLILWQPLSESVLHVCAWHTAWHHTCNVEGGAYVHHVWASQSRMTVAGHLWKVKFHRLLRCPAPTRLYIPSKTWLTEAGFMFTHQACVYRRAVVFFKKEELSAESILMSPPAPLRLNLHLMPSGRGRASQARLNSIEKLENTLRCCETRPSLFTLISFQHIWRLRNMWGTRRVLN